MGGARPPGGAVFYMVEHLRLGTWIGACEGGVGSGGAASGSGGADFAAPPRFDPGRVRAASLGDSHTPRVSVRMRACVCIVINVGVGACYVSLSLSLYIYIYIYIYAIHIYIYICVYVMSYAG